VQNYYFYFTLNTGIPYFFEIASLTGHNMDLLCATIQEFSNCFINKKVLEPPKPKLLEF